MYAMNPNVPSAPALMKRPAASTTRARPVEKGALVSTSSSSTTTNNNNNNSKTSNSDNNDNNV